MYYDESSFKNHHHQQSHRFVRGELATKLWPRQGENYWFPNWQELFHGFLVVQEGQPRQTIVAGGLEQSQGVACPPQRQQTASQLPHSGTQCLHLGTSKATQSPAHSTALSQQQSTSSVVPCSGTRSHADHATQLPHPSPAVSHAIAQTPALPSLEEMDHTQSAHAQTACPPAPGLISKYTIKSPFWLPQGWVTEIQMRRAGTTTRTRDKYYKHILSGRRCRSKSEVLHFISSGRKRDRRKKVLSLSAASHSFITNFAHRKHTILEASKPSSQGRLPSCPENTHPTHMGSALLLRQWAEQRPNSDSISSSSCSSLRQPGNMLPLSKEERPQKLPLTKKAKTLPLKIGEHRQASKLWQWLKKPVAQDNGEPLNHVIEKTASLMVDQRGVDDFTLRDQKSQRTIQLSMEIQAAHREMQATAEKLSREIQEARKDVELGSGTKLLTMPAETDVAPTDQTRAGKRCRETDVDPRPCAVKTSTIQESHGHDVATTEWPYYASGDVTHAIRRSDDAIGILPHGNPMPHASPQLTKSVATHQRSPPQVSQMPVLGIRHVTQLTLWPDAALHHGTHSAMRDVAEAAKRHVDASSPATQSEQKDFVRGINGIQEAERHVVAKIHAQRPTREIVAVGDVTQPALWPEVSTVHPTTPPAQIAYVSDMQAAERCVLVAGHTTQATQMAYMGDVTEATQVAEDDCVVVANVTQAARRQMIAMSNLMPATQIPVMSIGEAIPSLENPHVGNEMGNAAHRAAEGAAADPIHAAQAIASCGQDSGLQPAYKLSLRRQDEMTARLLRRKKFSAVLNPKLDLSRLNPALTTRQRAKVVQRMKTRHARELLATVGRHLCRKAIQRKP